jgi:2'-5' RNA ligase
VLPVREIEPYIEAWRRRFDASARSGMPAHITVLAPFLPMPRVDAEVLESLRLMMGDARPLSVELTHVAEFPGVIYLAPEPAAPIVGLTQRVVERWPEAPPYEGKFEVVPHLTIAIHAGEEIAEEIRAELAGRLPLAARLDEVWLFARTDGAWQRMASFTLGS